MIQDGRKWRRECGQNRSSVGPERHMKRVLESRGLIAADLQLARVCFPLSMRVRRRPSHVNK
jgi:hypothetical protein